MRGDLDRVMGGLLLAALLLTVVLSFLAIPIPAVLWWVDGVLTGAGVVYFVFSQSLGHYVIKRLLEAVFTIWVIATLTFGLLRVIPGGPFDSEKALPPEIKANIEAKYHLDKPLPMQYLMYMKGLVNGELGESFKYSGRDVGEIIADSLPASLQLGVFALLLSYLIGIPAGVWAASRHNTWQDHTLMALAISGVALPSFLVAPILILIFCFGLGWFEPALWEGPAFYVLPTVVLGTRAAAVIARLTRASVLEVIRADFIRTGRAKGLSEGALLFKHVLRNSLIPVVTFSGPLVAGIITGSFVVEQIFAIPGIGKHMVLSVSNRDYPLILGTTLVFSVILVLCNLMVDLLYAYFDPRIKLT